MLEKIFLTVPLLVLPLIFAVVFTVKNLRKEKTASQRKLILFFFLVFMVLLTSGAVKFQTNDQKEQEQWVFGFLFLNLIVIAIPVIHGISILYNRIIYTPEVRKHEAMDAELKAKQKKKSKDEPSMSDFYKEVFGDVKETRKKTKD